MHSACCRPPLTGIPALQPHGVVVVQYPTPEVPFIKEEDAVLAGELRPGLLFNRIIPRPPANPPYAPPPPPAPPPPDATTLLNSALSGTDNDTGTVAGGKGSVVGLWEAIGILVGGLMAVALGIFLCCWGANRRSSGHQRFSDDDVSKEDGGPEASSRLQGETPLDSFVLDSRAEVSARERSRFARAFCCLHGLTNSCLSAPPTRAQTAPAYSSLLVSLPGALIHPLIPRESFSPSPTHLPLC